MKKLLIFAILVLRFKDAFLSNTINFEEKNIKTLQNKTEQNPHRQPRQFIGTVGSVLNSIMEGSNSIIGSLLSAQQEVIQNMIRRQNQDYQSAQTFMSAFMPGVQLASDQLGYIRDAVLFGNSNIPELSYNKNEKVLQQSKPQKYLNVNNIRTSHYDYVDEPYQDNNSLKKRRKFQLNNNKKDDYYYDEIEENFYPYYDDDDETDETNDYEGNMDDNQESDEYSDYEHLNENQKNKVKNVQEDIKKVKKNLQKSDINSLQLRKTSNQTLELINGTRNENKARSLFENIESELENPEIHPDVNSVIQNTLNAFSGTANEKFQLFINISSNTDKLVSETTNSVAKVLKFVDQLRSEKDSTNDKIQFEKSKLIQNTRKSLEYFLKDLAKISSTTGRLLNSYPIESKKIIEAENKLIGNVQKVYKAIFNEAIREIKENSENSNFQRSIQPGYTGIISTSIDTNFLARTLQSASENINILANLTKNLSKVIEMSTRIDPIAMEKRLREGAQEILSARERLVQNQRKNAQSMHNNQYRIKKRRNNAYSKNQIRLQTKRTSSDNKFYHKNRQQLKKNKTHKQNVYKNVSGQNKKNEQKNAPLYPNIRLVFDPYHDPMITKALLNNNQTRYSKFNEQTINSKVQVKDIPKMVNFNNKPISPDQNNMN